MTDKSASLSQCLPFILGVTGHRDIDTSSVDLKESIRNSLIAWHNHIDNNTPIWLLTGLAAGADLLVAEVALELQEEWGQGKLKIIGCLPMPEDNYKADFENLEYAPDATKNFERVVDKIKATNGEVFAVRATLSDSDYQNAIEDTTYGKLRNSLYLNQGLFVAKYSNVLLSLWDGKPARGAGGTADVTYYKLGKRIEWPSQTENNALEPVSDFDGQTPGLVHHIYVKRYSTQPEEILPEKPIFSPSSSVNPSTSGWLYDSANNDGKSKSDLPSFITKEFTTLIAQLKTYNEMAVEFISEKGKENSFHDIADSIAGNYQKKYRWVILTFFVVAVLGYVCYELIGSFIATTPEIRGGLILIVLLMIGVAGGVILFTKNRDWKWKYQLARGVAEGGRIRSGLNLADVPPSSAPLIPRAFRSHLALLTHAISITEFEWWRNKIPYSHVRFQSEVIFWEIVKSQIKSQWINRQSEFLGNRLSSTRQSLSEFIYKRPKLAAEQMNLWAKGCFLGAIYSGAVIFALLINQYFMNTNIFNKPIDYLMLLVQFGLVIGGVIALWNELAGYESTAKGYASLKALYDRANKLLEGEFTPSKHQMLLELAREAIFEHVSWTMSESNNDLKKK